MATRACQQPNEVTLEESGHKSWVRLPLHREFAYMPLYWEWLEDILVCYKDKLTTFHLFDALYALLFLYDRFPGLPLLRHLYNEVVPTQWKLTNRLPLHCIYLFITYLKPMRGHKGKLTIDQWITFGFQGPSKYHISRKSGQENHTPNPGILSFIISTRARGWGDCQVIFDEQEVAKGQRTETFLALEMLVTYAMALLALHHPWHQVQGIASLWQSLRVSTRNSMRSLIHILVEVGTFPANFLYAWLVKNFDTYELVSEVASSPGMLKFSGLGQAKLPQLEQA
ncbi:hypothetical protein Cgig2_009781 [Carnegiea gigantea]|uniref:Uncharacterized protein n=1 Tax=Carnegiea gigantea TaxID=171969 RepID=A0A9Q1GSH9_9CARY|nr:hypothetical protein Cgig2_009781 [Carnegiea gigantea]